ncbi:hypothetical protein ACJMK2_021530 [Sinanodonta woodiana]|uniref:Uncharacterized protein n=1 Tax=Sinanodonta woodiana TaxID=1069815 RepID=A0ABD3TIC0_SINWO
MIISRILLLLAPVATELFEINVTAGNTRCRLDNTCGFHKRTTYSWCYTDYSNNWGYCCTDTCRLKGKDFFWCPSGDTYQHCGGTRTSDVLGRPCLKDHQCGMHFEEGQSGFHWCFVDLNLNWGYCCTVLETCDYHDESYKWCYISGYRRNNKWQYCVNDE